MHSLLLSIPFVAGGLALLAMSRFWARMRRESKAELARIRASEARIKAIADAALGRGRP